MLKFNFNNINSKKIIFAIIFLLVAASFGYKIFFQKNDFNLSLAEVKKGDILQTVLATGQIQKEEKINLAFKNSGRVEKIFANVGDKVAAGTRLMKLETNELYIKLREAKSNLAVVQAKFDKIIAGAITEEVKVGQTKVSNKEILLNSAKQNLENEYQDALTVLDDVYLTSYNAKNAVDALQRNYFNSSNQESIQVREEKERISKAVSAIKSQADFVESNNGNENIDSALSKTKEELSKIADGLTLVREICETPAYWSSVSSIEKTSIDTHRSNINAALSGVDSVRQSILSQKSALAEAEGNLQAAKDDLDLLLAPARAEDINLHKAQIEEADSQVKVLESQLGDAYLRIPVDGQITDIKKKIGEYIQPAADAAVVVVPVVPYTVETDIYEEDVVKIKIGNSVDISLVAFPDKIFKGEIISIDPAEKIIDGVVYYKTNISFKEPPQNLKPGMTADVVIQTNERKNILVLPESAVRKREGKEFVEIAGNNQKEEREIKTGLLGNDGMKEILSGLKEGEKIILP